MSNIIEYKDKLGIHPGYCIQEIIESDGMSQETFANLLGTTPKNLSILIRGKQRLSMDMAIKLSKMLGTSVEYWINMQNSYDKFVAEMESEKELEEEKRFLKKADVPYFEDGINKLEFDGKLKAVREKLRVSSLLLLKNRNLAANLNSCPDDLTEENIIGSNIMILIALRQTIDAEPPEYNKKKFKKAVEYAAALHDQQPDSLELIKKAFWDAGVVISVIPNYPGAAIDGATKKLTNKVMLMLNEDLVEPDAFWFTLFHEASHILNNDFGAVSKNNYEKLKELDHRADEFAVKKLIHDL